MSLIDDLQIRDVVYGDKVVTAKMYLNDFHAQPYGYVNGGATIAFGEVLAGMATYHMGGGDYAGVGQTVTAHHISPRKPEGYVIAKGVLLHGGKRSHTWDISVYDETEKVLISKITVVNALVPLKVEK